MADEQTERVADPLTTPVPDGQDSREVVVLYHPTRPELVGQKVRVAAHAVGELVHWGRVRLVHHDTAPAGQAPAGPAGDQVEQPPAPAETKTAAKGR